MLNLVCAPATRKFSAIKESNKSAIDKKCGLLGSGK